jgi:predicted chitinase
MSVLQAFLTAGVPSGIAHAEAAHAERAMLENDIGTQPRAAMFLAQVLHESVALRYFEEIASGAAYQGRMGNVNPGDGVRYKGRGPIQLTGRDNYRLYGQLLGLPLEAQPTLVSRHDIGWRTSGRYWSHSGCNDLADADQFVGVTRAINGGTNGLNSRWHYYNLVKTVDCRPQPPDPLAHLTARERSWCHEYDHLHRTQTDPDRRRILRRVMRVQRKKIYRSANAEPNGWSRLNRIKRYKSLLARTQ